MLTGPSEMGRVRVEPRLVGEKALLRTTTNKKLNKDFISKREKRNKRCYLKVWKKL